MLKSKEFLVLEKNAPLLNLNRSFLETEGENIFSRTKHWSSLAGVAETPSFSHRDEDPTRIIVLDAERTFVNDQHRKKLMKFLTTLSHRIGGEYHQALSYVSGFMLLSMPEEEVMAVVQKLNSDEKFIPRYWRHEAVAFATDAYVFQHLLEHFLPQVHSHFKKNMILPETYCQKWFVGLCINVLPYSHLYRFFELFLSHGFPFLFQFGLSLIENTKEHLLAANDPGSIFAILRMDPKTVEQKKINFDPILEKALSYDIRHIQFPQLREELYEKHLKARLEAAAKQKQKLADEDHSSEDDDSDDDDEEGEECEMCHEMMPEVFCKDCRLLLCEDCQKKTKSGHLPSHSTCDPSQRDEIEDITKHIKTISLNGGKQNGKPDHSGSEEEED